MARWATVGGKIVRDVKVEELIDPQRYNWWIGLTEEEREEEKAILKEGE